MSQTVTTSEQKLREDLEVSKLLPSGKIAIENIPIAYGHQDGIELFPVMFRFFPTAFIDDKAAEIKLAHQIYKGASADEQEPFRNQVLAFYKKPGLGLAQGTNTAEMLLAKLEANVKALAQKQGIGSPQAL